MYKYLLVWILAIIPHPLFADLPEKIEVQGAELQLSGRGDLYYWFWKVYQVGLYLPEGVERKEALKKEHPKALRFHYYRNVPKDYVLQAKGEVLPQNISQDTLNAISSDLQYFNTFYPDMSKNEVAEIAFHPGFGVSLSKNHHELVTVNNEDLAFAIFSIWLGKSPIDPKLKVNLLETAVTSR